MITQLRPLSLGEILDRTAELYRRNFLLFAGIAAIFSGAMLVIQMLHLGVLALLGHMSVTGELHWGSGAVSVVEVLAYLLLAGLAIAANNRAVAWVHLGEPATIRGACRSILPRLRRYLWLMTITGFRAWAPLAVLYVAIFTVILSVLPSGFLTNPGVAQSAAAQNPSAFIYMGVGMLILAPLFLLALVYGTWMSLRYSLAMPACVVEELPAGLALKRSIELSKGSRGRIFVLGILVYAVRMILGIVLGFPFIAFTFMHPGHAFPIGLLALQQIANFITSTLIGPIYATGLTLFYYDQRIRKEGFDIEWMMQAAGLTALPHSALPQAAPAEPADRLTPLNDEQALAATDAPEQP
jgi:hypothetical protein